MSAAIKKATILLLVMVIFIFLAKTFLGEENVTVGVGVVLMSFMLLGKDLTGNLLKNTLELICLIIFICFCTYIANFNIYLGLVINFIGVFVTTYASMSDLKRFIYQPFLIVYVLMLTNMAHNEDISLRFIGFIIGGLFAMFLQYLINGKKGSKVAKKSLSNIVNYLIEEITLVKEEKPINSYKDKINEEIRRWNDTILERRDSYFDFTKVEEFQLNIISTLESFQLSIEDLEKYNKDNHYKEVLLDLDNFFNTLKKTINKKDCYKELIKEFKEFHEKYERESENDYLLFEVFKTLERLDFYIIDMINAYNDKSYRNSVLQIEKPSIWYMIKASVSKNSVRFTFSLRVALMISIAYFVTRIFNFNHGSWIIITIAMASVPYKDNMKYAGFSRIYGTLIGASIFFVLFTFMHDEIVRIAIIMVGFYIMNMTKNNIAKNSCSTILALGIFGLSETNTLSIASDRAICVIIGVIIAFIFSILVLPYDIEKETKTLIDKYNKISKESIKKLENLDKIKENRIFIKNVLNISRALEHKISVNNRALNNEDIDKFIQEQRNIINNLYILMSNMDDLTLREGVTKENFKKYIRKFYNNLEEEHEKLLKRFNEYSLKNFSMNDKFRYYSICKLFYDERNLDNFIKEKKLIE